MIEARQGVQMITLLIAIVTLFELVAVVYCKIWPWRLVLFPIIVTIEVIVFYGWLVIGTPLSGYSIGPHANNISAAIRMQTGSVVVSYLSYMIYKKYRNKKITRE